jgi:hypothetical protein
VNQQAAACKSMKQQHAVRQQFQAASQPAFKAAGACCEARFVLFIHIHAYEYKFKVVQVRPHQRTCMPAATGRKPAQ